MSGVFSLYVPGDSVFHRLGVGWKYAILMLVSLPAIIVGDLWLSLAMLALVMVLLAACRVGVRYSWAIPNGLWLMLAIMVGYQVLIGTPVRGIIIAANLLTAVYASRLVTLTTPGNVLIDGLVGALRPLRVLGVNPERVGLAIAVMLRSIPLLLESFSEVRQAARARGRERHLFALLTPVVVRAVGHAQATGAALAARGLGDDGPDGVGSAP